METRGLKSNSSELSCLSWLPATLMMSDQTELSSMETAFSHYVYGKFFRPQGQLTPLSVVRSAKIRTGGRFLQVLVTCKYKKDQIKNNQEKVETPFSPLYVNGGFLLPWKPQFWSNLPQKLMQPFLHPNDATHKIWSQLANWLQRYSSSKVWNFRHSRAINSKIIGLVSDSAQNEHNQVFMPVLVTSNFDDDSIKNEPASMETPFSHYKPMGKFLDAQGQLTP